MKTDHWHTVIFWEKRETETHTQCQLSECLACCRDVALLRMPGQSFRYISASEGGEPCFPSGLSSPAQTSCCSTSCGHTYLRLAVKCWQDLLNTQGGIFRWDKGWCHLQLAWKKLEASNESQTQGKSKPFLKSLEDWIVLVFGEEITGGWSLYCKYGLLHRIGEDVWMVKLKGKSHENTQRRHQLWHIEFK